MQLGSYSLGSVELGGRLITTNNFTQTLTETFSLAESFVRFPTHLLSEAFTLTETFTAALHQYFKTLTDTLSLSDLALLFTLNGQRFIPWAKRNKPAVPGWISRIKP